MASEPTNFRNPTAGVAAATFATHARLVGISKSFGAFKALDDVSLTLNPGQIHAVLGENGAGKTTLVRILAGIMSPDTGYIELNGQKVELSGRKDGAGRGIGIVQQHYGLVEELTGAENYLLGHPRAGRWLDYRQANKELTRTARDFGIVVDPLRVVRTLTVGERQRLEILIALTVGAKILILDEPTAALVTNEVVQLIPMLRRLAGQGTSIIYITHKLDEVMQIADEVTVLRRGRATGQFARAVLDKVRLTETMIGALPPHVEAGRREPGQPVVELFAVSVADTALRRGLRLIDLTIRRNEIVGIAGVAGNGQEALAEVLRGLSDPIDGTLRRISARVAYIPEDRARQGLAMSLSVADNAIIYRYRDPDFVKGWRINPQTVAHFTRRLTDQAGIAGAGPRLPAGALSGGNQQKLVIARELDKRPDLIVAHNPYRGLDVGATEAVRRRLLDARDAGAGVLFISPDLDELFDICSRIVFLSNGKIAGTIDPKATAISEVGSLLGGSAS
jgi:general nucleoside transport system ATP-binding protein